MTTEEAPHSHLPADLALGCALTLWILFACFVMIGRTYLAFTSGMLSALFVGCYMMHAAKHFEGMHCCRRHQVVDVSNGIEMTNQLSA